MNNRMPEPASQPRTGQPFPIRLCNLLSHCAAAAVNSCSSMPTAASGSLGAADEGGAKIKPRISFHILRHTWASLAVMAKVPLLVVAKNLGHKDTRMVERHYGHLEQSFIVDAIHAGAPRFGAAAPTSVVPLHTGKSKRK
jgi:hypothetical protein